MSSLPITTRGASALLASYDGSSYELAITSENLSNYLRRQVWDATVHAIIIRHDVSSDLPTKRIATKVFLVAANGVLENASGHDFAWRFHPTTQCLTLKEAVRYTWAAVPGLTADLAKSGVRDIIRALAAQPIFQRILLDEALRCREGQGDVWQALMQQLSERLSSAIQRQAERLAATPRTSLPVPIIKSRDPLAANICWPSSMCAPEPGARQIPKRKVLHDNVAAAVAGDKDWVDREAKRVKWAGTMAITHVLCD